MRDIGKGEITLSDGRRGCEETAHETTGPDESACILFKSTFRRADRHGGHRGYYPAVGCVIHRALESRSNLSTGEQPAEPQAAPQNN